MCRGINNVRCRTTQSSISKDVPHQSDLALDINTSRNHSTCTFHAVANRQKLEINRWPITSYQIITQTKTALLVLKAVLLPFMRKQSALSSRILPETSHIRYPAGIVCPKSDKMLSSGRESCLETLIKRIDDFTLIGVTKNVALGSTDINSPVVGQGTRG